MERLLLIFREEFFFAGTCLLSCFPATDMNVTILHYEASDTRIPLLEDFSESYRLATRKFGWIIVPSQEEDKENAKPMT
jgi:hypothetical protein